MKVITSKDIGNLIRTQRKALGWSQATLADKAMVSRDWIVQLEKGKPTAELGLVLRALRTLRLSMDVAPRPAPSKMARALNTMMEDLAS